MQNFRMGQYLRNYANFVIDMQIAYGGVQWLKILKFYDNVILSENIFNIINLKICHEFPIIIITQG